MVVEQSQAESVRLRQQLTKANRRNAELKQELESNRDKREAEKLRKQVAELEHNVRCAHRFQCRSTMWVSTGLTQSSVNAIRFKARCTRSEHKRRKYKRATKPRLPT